MEIEAGLKLWAESEDRICKTIESLRPRSYNPIHKSVFGSAISTAPATPLVVDVNDQPSPGNMWYIHRIGVFGNDGHTALWMVGVRNGTVTAGAGSATLIGGASLAGFDVTFSTAPTAAGTVTVSAVQSVTGTNITLTYNIPVGATSLSERFNPPLIANPIGNTITVTVAATGAVGNIEAYSTIPGTGAPQGDVEIYAGMPPDPNEASFPLMDLLATSPSIPYVQTFGRRTQNVHANEHIYAVAYGITANQQIVFCAQVSEWPVEAEEALVI